MNAKFKEGDKVKVIASEERLRTYYIVNSRATNKKGIITKVKSPNSSKPFYSYDVQVSGARGNFSYKESFLEKVEEKTFPRMMMVSDNESPSSNNRRKVIAYIEGHNYPYIVDNRGGDSFNGYKFAKEIEESREIKENTIVKVIDGGHGALCANEFVGRVCSKEDAKKFKEDGLYLGGMCIDDEAIFIVSEKGCYGVNTNAKLKALS